MVQTCGCFIDLKLFKRMESKPAVRTRLMVFTAHLESSCESLGHLLGNILHTSPHRLDIGDCFLPLENAMQKNDIEDGRKDSRYTSAIPIDPSAPHCEEDILFNLSHARPCPPLLDLSPRPCFHPKTPIQVLISLTVLRATLRVAQQSPPVQQISNVNFDAFVYTKVYQVQETFEFRTIFRSRGVSNFQRRCTPVARQLHAKGLDSSVLELCGTDLTGEGTFSCLAA